MSRMNMGLIAWLALAVLILDNADAANQSYFSHEYKLFHTLFGGDYNRHARPIRDSSQPVVVNMTYELFGIYGVDEVGLTMQTTGIIIAQWYDENLVWDPNDYGGLEQIVEWPDQVWLPDMVLQNSGDTFYHLTFRRDFRVKIEYTGRVIWNFGGIFSTGCNFNMYYYPLDLQSCQLVFENWQYDSGAVKLVTNESDGVIISEHDFSQNGVWHLDHVSSSAEEFTNNEFPEIKYPRVKFAIYMQRKPHFYIINVMLPSFFLAIVALMVFWTTPASGEKISLSVTVLLAFAVFQVVVMESTPENSDKTPLLTQLTSILMAMSAMSVCVAIFVVYLNGSCPSNYPPRWMSFIMFRVLARVMCVSNIPKPHNDEGDGINMMINNVLEIGEADALHGKVNEITSNASEEIHKLGAILQKVTKIVDKIEEKEKDDARCDEWKAIASIIDRFFFWVGLIVVLITIMKLFLDLGEYDFTT